MWKLGFVDLEAFGLIPSLVDGSNIAVGGCFDMPVRVGKTSHNWTDESSVEPYVHNEEIRFAGRDIVFVSLLKAETEKEALVKCYELYKLLGESTTLVDFIADTYGTFSVYIKDSITTEYVGDGWCKIKITMREPVVEFTDEKAVANNAELGIDGVDFKDLGLIMLDVTGRFGNPKKKEFKATGYDTEAFKVMPVENREITVKALLDADSVSDFKSRLNKLYNLLKKEGLRYITYRSDYFRTFFVKDGVQVTDISETADRIIAVVNIKLTEVEAVVDGDWGFLLADNEAELTDLLGEKIVVIPETEDEQEGDNYLGLSNFQVDASADGGEYEIQVTSNTTWVVLENTPWLELADSTGAGNGTIRIEVEPYAGTTERTTKVVIQSKGGNKTVNVRQGFNLGLTVDKTAINVSPAGGTATIVIQSNTSWTITENANWMSVTPNSGTGNATVTVTVDASTIDRTMPITVTGSNVTRTINVTQSVEVSVGGDGVLEDFALPEETHWNNFRPDAIPDFQIPTRVDAVTGETLANKGLIWHAPYRNIFGSTGAEQITKMLKKGVVAINAAGLPPYFDGLLDIISGSQIVVDSGLGATADGSKQPAELSYEAFANFCRSPFGYAETYRIPKDSQGRYKTFLAVVDYENIYTKLTTQEDANFHVVGFNAGTNAMTGRYAFQYATGINHGAYASAAAYNGLAASAWTTPADGSVGSELQGKSLASNPRNAVVVEISYAFETFLPQNYQTKDQFGNNWIVINHFGNECTNTYGWNSETNAEHWAAQLDLVGLTHNLHKQWGQEVIAQLKPVNERDNGYHYSSIHPEWQDGKWISEYNRYGIWYLQPIYDQNGNFLYNVEAKNPIGTEYIPNFIAEGQVYLAYFDGARWINWWSSSWGNTAVPRPKSSNERRGNRYDDNTYGNGDFEGYTYTLKAHYQLSRKINIVGGAGAKYSFFDICDGTEEYLWKNTKVIYPNSTAVQQLTGLDWQINKRTAARAVENVALRCVFLLAFQPYGCEDNQITFVYDRHGADIHDLIDVPAGKFVIKAYSFDAGQQTTTPPTTVTAPVISSSPTTVLAGGFTTFSANSGAGTVTWYKNGISTGTGNSITVSSPIQGDVYTAKRTVLGVVSSVSNSITVQAAAAVQNPVVFLFFGESNAGGQTPNDTAPIGELGTRNKVKIWNPYNDSFEVLNIGGNNDNGTNISNSYHGWELGLANMLDSGYYAKPEAYVVKLAFSGAMVRQFLADANPRPNYWDIVTERINKVKAYFVSIGKTPEYHIVYSQGINDKVYNLIDVNEWGTQTQSLQSRIRTYLGVNAPIYQTKFGGIWWDYTDYNNKINSIVASGTNMHTIESQSLSRLSDDVHWTYSGQKEIIKMVIDTINAV